MTEWHRFLLSLIVLSVYSGLIGMKIPEFRKTYINDRNARWKAIRFDVIRLFTDGILLLGFLTSPLYSAWFALFPETILGFFTGCFILISITLLISVFVDWIPVHRSCREKGISAPSFPGFLLRQFVHIVQIESAMALAWCVFLFLEPTKMSLWCRIAFAAIVLLLFRFILRLVWNIRTRSARQKKTE